VFGSACQFVHLHGIMRPEVGSKVVEGVLGGGKVGGVGRGVGF